MKLIFIRLLCIIIIFLSLLVDKNDPVEDLARHARQSTLVAQEIGKKKIRFPDRKWVLTPELAREIAALYYIEEFSRRKRFGFRDVSRLL